MTNWKERIAKQKQEREKKAQAEKRKYEVSLQNPVKVQKLDPDVQNDKNVIKWDTNDETVDISGIPIYQPPKRITALPGKMFGDKRLKTTPQPPPTDSPQPLAITQCPALPPPPALQESEDTSCGEKVESIQKDVNWNELMVKKEVVHQNEESLRQVHAEVRKGHKKGNTLQKIRSITQKAKIIEKQKEKLQQAENIMTMKLDPGYEPHLLPPPVDGATETEPVSSADSLPDLVPIDESEKNLTDQNDKVVASLLDQVTVITKTETPSGLFSRSYWLSHFEFLRKSDIYLETQKKNR